MKNNAKGVKSFEVNYRSVLAMHEIGKGHTALSTLCGYMNIPEPFQDIRKNTPLCLYRDS